jgi:non-heme chloroperoxidase
LSLLTSDIDTYADDLLALFEHLDLKDACMVGHSTGGGEVARFLGRHGTSRVRKAVLISAICPLMLQTDANPQGTPMSAFDGLRNGMKMDRSQFFLDVPTGPFFGFNRDFAKISQGMIWAWWQQGMMCGYKNAYDCIAVFSETDTSEDLRKIDIPVLVIHGYVDTSYLVTLFALTLTSDDDQVVPISASAHEAIKLLKYGSLKVYPGGSHALHNVVPDEISHDLLEFFRS